MTSSRLPASPSPVLILDAKQHISTQFSTISYVKFQSSDVSTGTLYPPRDNEASLRQHQHWQDEEFRAVHTLRSLSPSKTHMLLSPRPWPKQVVNTFSKSRYQYPGQYVLGIMHHTSSSGMLQPPFLSPPWSPWGHSSQAPIKVCTLLAPWSWQKQVVNKFCASRHRFDNKLTMKLLSWHSWEVTFPWLWRPLSLAIHSP